jgi:hypothetical protein
MKGVVKHYPSNEWAFLFVRFGFLEIEDRKIEERSHSEGLRFRARLYCFSASRYLSMP